LAPMATGMSLTLVFLALRRVRPKTAKYVVWSRIDQKSCFKSIASAGFEAAVVELKRNGEELTTDVEAMKAKVEELGAKNVLAVMTTTSCFAPRACDDLPAVARLCRSADIPHVVNNAYGLQSSKCAHLLEWAAKECHGRYDVFVQSSDKNLLVPVGGAIIAGFDKSWVQAIAKAYPGRASSSTAVDVLMTLLAMGADGWRFLTRDRKANYGKLAEALRATAAKHGEKVLATKGNPISLGNKIENCPHKSTIVHIRASFLFFLSLTEHFRSYDVE